jgi:hypothetical protein
MRAETHPAGISFSTSVISMRTEGFHLSRLIATAQFLPPLVLSTSVRRCIAAECRGGPKKIVERQAVCRRVCCGFKLCSKPSLWFFARSSPAISERGSSRRSSFTCLCCTQLLLQIPRLARLALSCARARSWRYLWNSTSVRAPLAQTSLNIGIEDRAPRAS